MGGEVELMADKNLIFLSLAVSRYFALSSDLCHPQVNLNNCFPPPPSAADLHPSEVMGPI